MGPTTDALLVTIKTNQEETKSNILEVYRNVEKVHDKILQLEHLIIKKIKQEPKEDESYYKTFASKSQIKDRKDFYDQSNTSSDTKLVTIASLQDLSINEIDYKSDVIQSSLLDGTTSERESSSQITVSNGLATAQNQIKVCESNAASNQELIQNNDNSQYNVNNVEYIEPDYNLLYEENSNGYLDDLSHHDNSLNFQDAPMCYKKIQFKCNLCEYNCIERIDLSKHKELSHNKKMFWCNECAYLTSNRTNYRRHTSAHKNGIRQLECNCCGYIAPTSKSLKWHLNSLHSVQINCV